MKLVSEVGVVERSGAFKESSFNIEMNSKAFYVLSAQLYSNKIQAVIRELSTNAHDAQVYSKTVKPFEVHLPSQWAPEFSVRDFGPGLSEEDVQGLYTTYFKSNKIDSNDFVGCLGLGSKSPFAYTDSFTVTSYFGGECKTYTMYLDERKFPKCSLMTTTPSNEPNGLKVSVSVKNSDVWTFSSEASRVFSFFKELPKFTGAKPSLVTIKGTLEGKDWKFGVQHGFGNGGAMAVMGNIAYPIASAKNHVKQHLQKLCNAPIVIYVGIGDIEPSPNREEVSYTKETIAAINDKLELISAELLKSAQMAISKCKNLFDARHEYQVLKHGNTFNYVDGKLVKYQGQSVDGITIMADDKKFEVNSYNMYGSKLQTNQYNSIETNQSDEYYWIDDEKCHKNLLAYVKGFASPYSYSRSRKIYTIQPAEVPVQPQASGQITQPVKLPTVRTTNTQAEFETFLGKPIKLLSSLPKAPAAIRRPRNKYKIQVADLVAQKREQLEDTITVGEYYIYVNRNSDLAPYTSHDGYWMGDSKIWSLVKEWNLLFPTKKISGRILMLKKHTDEPKTRKYKLVNLHKFIHDELTAFYGQKKNKDLVAECLYFSQTGYNTNNTNDANIFQVVTDPMYKGSSNAALTKVEKSCKELAEMKKYADFTQSYFSGLVVQSKKPSIDSSDVIADFQILTLIFDKYHTFSSWDVKKKQIVLDLLK